MITVDDALRISRNAKENADIGVQGWPEEGALIVLADVAAPNPPQSLSSWQPISTAQNDKPYIVGWIDDDGTERHDFDIMDDGVWSIHDDICEMAEACAPAGGIMPNRTAPYTHCIELPPLPEPAP